ncbi:hypothetical protein ABXJ76_04190 [Methylobacter sp. G7]|uniref:hypothetical protein n=1 Tax=Methylobacter sp. G7 TaxID=3230117 RepID=UPI003D803364
MVDITEALRTLAEVDNDFRHPVNNPLNPAHRLAKKYYAELADYVFSELSKRRGGRDYSVSRNAPNPPRLIETRPGFKPP